MKWENGGGGGETLRTLLLRELTRSFTARYSRDGSMCQKSPEASVSVQNRPHPYLEIVMILDDREGSPKDVQGGTAGTTQGRGIFFRGRLELTAVCSSCQYQVKIVL